MRPYFLSFLIVIISLSCTSEHETPNIFSLKDLPQAELFAEGVVSTEAPEFATAISPNGKEVFFNRTSAQRDTIQIFYSRNENETWSEPQPLPFSNGAYSDIDPFLSADGQRLYFCSNRPIEGDELKDFDIWYVEKNNDAWREPTNLGLEINSTNNEVFVSQSVKGDLYFAVFNDEEGSAWIYESKWKNGDFTTPQRVPIPVNPSFRLTNPAIAPDGSYLIFSSSQMPGHGSADLQIAYVDPHGHWLVALNLGEKINSSYAEFAPHISPDGSQLYFTSERPGLVASDSITGRRPGDIYMVKLPTRKFE